MSMENGYLLETATACLILEMSLSKCKFSVLNRRAKLKRKSVIGFDNIICTCWAKVRPDRTHTNSLRAKFGSKSQRFVRTNCTAKLVLPASEIRMSMRLKS